MYKKYKWKFDYEYIMAHCMLKLFLWTASSVSNIAL